jgi:tetratricopeptide (TPR) repeat protein
MSMMEAQRAQYPDAPAKVLDRLQARIELLQNQPAQAFDLLDDSSDPHAQPSKWLAGLRAGELSPADVEKLAQDFAAGGHAPADQRAALIVAAEAALDDKDPANRVALLEQALTIPATVRTDQPPFDLDSDDVWHALLGLGQMVAHQRKLDESDTAALLAAAAAEKQTVESQGLVALAAFGPDSALRIQAQAELCRLLADQPRGDELLRQLYLHSKRFSALASVPLPVRHRLVRDAIAAGNMMLAAKLLATLDQPPPDGDAAEWQLERAHVFILTGRADAGVAAISSLLDSGAVFSFDDLQPSLFALQAIGRHEDAIRIFRQLLSRDPPPAVRQKLLYWLGDSYAAVGKNVEAAKVYLQSATLVDDVSTSRWARTARYQAAGALAKAGFTDDARRVYQRLLDASRDPARRAALRQKIAELH